MFCSCPHDDYGYIHTPDCPMFGKPEDTIINIDGKDYKGKIIRLGNLPGENPKPEHISIWPDGSYRDSLGAEFIRLEGEWYVPHLDKPLVLSDADMVTLYGPLLLKD